MLAMDFPVSNKRFGQEMNQISQYQNPQFPLVRPWFSCLWFVVGGRRPWRECSYVRLGTFYIRFFGYQGYEIRKIVNPAVSYFFTSKSYLILGPEMDPLLTPSMQRASFKCEMPRLELKSWRTFLAIKRCQRTKIRKVISQHEARKKSCGRYATTAVKLLTSHQHSFLSPFFLFLFPPPFSPLYIYFSPKSVKKAELAVMFQFQSTIARG